MNTNTYTFATDRESERPRERASELEAINQNYEIAGPYSTAYSVQCTVFIHAQVDTIDMCACEGKLDIVIAIWHAALCCSLCVTKARQQVEIYVDPHDENAVCHIKHNRLLLLLPLVLLLLLR